MEGFDGQQRFAIVQISRIANVARVAALRLEGFAIVQISRIANDR